jgi:hypothetical protein
VLGGTERTLGLIQAGSPAPGGLATVIVIDGAASALGAATETPISNDALRLAEAAARALCADLVAVAIALGAGEPMVWDVQPVPGFRDALPLVGGSVARTMAHAVELRLQALAEARLPRQPADAWISITREGMRGDVAVRA